MNKKDIPILIILVALWIAWPKVYQRYFQKPVPPAAQETEETATAPAEGDAATAPVSEPAIEPPGMPPAPAPAAVETIPEPEPAAHEPEETVLLDNDKLQVTLTSLGGGIKGALLKEYRETVDRNSGPVQLDFADLPALVYERLPGLGRGVSFQITEPQSGKSAVMEKQSPAGLRLTRTIRLEDGYRLIVEDEFVNTSAQPLQLPSYLMTLGTMRNLASDQKAVRGMVYLGVDLLLEGGEGVKHLGKKIPRWFDKEGPNRVEHAVQQPADWVAAKNKFFVQILTPDDGMDDCLVRATRQPHTRAIDSVSAIAVLPALDLAPNQRFVRASTYYVGPKKLAELKKYGLHQVDVMGFFLAPIAKLLLVVMNFIHDHLWPHNYGLAIMLLTIIIRVIFWPLTHKGTENMKRMQELQPLMKEIREKYKDNAQKQQQEMMALYKKHKVNPMMGCLPMVVQIPIFIALFYVLRSAIELRFAEFLWVKDLSAPENLLAFGFTLPLVGWDHLNILPLLMAASTLVQQKLSPTGGDPNQQKIMMFMPFMMLFFLYNFASGLVLYWTTNNVIMIVQQLHQRRGRAAPASAS